MRTVIGLVGKPGAGKSGVAEILQAFAGKDNVPTEKFGPGDIIRDSLTLWGLPLTRENQQELPVVMEEKFGSGLLACAIRNRITLSKARIIIVDAIRWPDQEDAVREFEGKIVYVFAAPGMRCLRMKNRAEKIGEAELTFEKFTEQDEAPTEAHIEAIGNRADKKIINNGTIEDLEEKVRKFYEGHVAALL